MNDNKALCIFLCVLMLCITTCSASEDWVAAYKDAHKCLPPAEGKKE